MDEITLPTVAAYSLLPFVTPPQIKTVTIGKPGLGELEVTKYWGLMEDEQLFIQQNSADLEISKLAIKIASSIASKLNSTILNIANALLRSDFDFFKDHLDELFAYKDKVKEVERKREIILVTAIIKFRILSSWTIEKTQDSKQIPPQLLLRLAEFAWSEQNGWEEDEESTQPKDKSQLEALIRELLKSEEEENATDKTSQIKALIRQLLEQESPAEVQTAIANSEAATTLPTTLDSETEPPAVKIPLTLDSEDSETPVSES